MKEGWAITYKCVFVSLLFFCCRQRDKPAEIPQTTTTKDYIRPIPGKSDSIPAEESERGQVLIAYADCYTCHKIDKRSKGPAFKDIAKRYPANEGYINLLAQKIIVGGSGAWGYPVMAAHPDISVENATLMVKYILSLKE